MVMVLQRLILEGKPVLDVAAGDGATLVLDMPAGTRKTLELGVGCASPVTPASVLPAASVAGPGTPVQQAVERTAEVSVNIVPSALATHSGIAPNDPPPSSRAVT